MTGPPTPPATSPVELQDQARSNAAAAAASEQSAAPTVSGPAIPELRPELYQNALPAIIDCIQRNNYARLVHVAGDMDFNTASDRHPSRLVVVAPLVLGHLVLDDTASARYALLRLSENLLALPLAGALQSLVLSTINREHAKVYEQAGALLKVVSQADFGDNDLASVITALATAFLEAFRRRTFELLSKAYTSLQAQLACDYLGWPEADVVNVAEKQGWAYNATTHILTPRLAPVVPSTKMAVSPSSSGLDAFHFVTDSVAKLEV